MSADSKFRRQQEWAKEAALVTGCEADATRPVLHRTQPKVNQKLPSKLSPKNPPDLKKAQNKVVSAVRKPSKGSKTFEPEISDKKGPERSDATDIKQQFQSFGKSIDDEDATLSICSSLLEDSSCGLEVHASCSSVGSYVEQEVLLDELSLSSTPEAKPNVLRAAALTRRRSKSIPHGASKAGKVVPEGIPSSPLVPTKKRCGWITSQSDPIYVAHHDNEWGVPVHDDKLLFELLILSGVLAELSWPTILKRRQEFRDGFSGFDPNAVASFDEQKVTSLMDRGIVQHESKILDIVNNAKRCLDVRQEYGSLDQYFWKFVNHKPICTKYRISAQVPKKTPRSELISKDLVRRGFRFVGPTIMYSFMQVTGMTNDHTVQCFRHQECLKLAIQSPEKPLDSEEGRE